MHLHRNVRSPSRDRNAKKCARQNRTARFSRGRRATARVLESFPPSFDRSGEPNYTTNLMNEWASKYSGPYKLRGVYKPRSMPCSGFCGKIKESISLTLRRINSHCQCVYANAWPLGPHGLKITTFFYSDVKTIFVHINALIAKLNQSCYIYNIIFISHRDKINFSLATIALIK